MIYKDDTKNERKHFYFDLICGMICSGSALFGIIFVTVIDGITSMTGFLTGLTFWMLYFFLSLLLVFYGLYSRWKEKHFDEQKPRKDLRPPIV